ncbi:bifunctional diguanylate cyclase/phosphodiesterase [Ornithinibacillus californiensis]|uniref:bifunctional diguanylate cyclase/phosphodiesterase n=1 Tax=Ornithinibacillus californiensis TaxID=161536 RepID=UPI00069DFE24|nr:EAL domain-containing protein [Ornithinibacillus californiensis]
MIHTSTSPLLHTISILIVIISSYTTLVLVERIFDELRTRKVIWIIAGALIMATGIFSMHFIGMIAHHVADPMTYDGILLITSYLFAFISSLLAFLILYIHPLSKIKTFLSGVAIGIGIISLHLTALYSMIEPFQMNYSSVYFYLSIVFAILFSILSINMFVKMRDKPDQSVSRTGISALLLGLTISIMHHCGMRAVEFIPHEHDPFNLTGIDTFTLGIILTISSLLIIIITLITAIFDGHVLKKERKYVKQLIESENRYQNLVENSPVPLIVHDGKHILFINTVSLKIIHASKKSEIIGKPIMDFVHPDFIEITKVRLHQVKAGKPLGFKDIKLIALDGTTIDAETTIMPIIYENKPAFQLILRDLTEQNKVKRELSEKEQRFTSLFEYNPDPVFSFDHTGKFQEVNAAIWDILGYSKDDLLQMVFHDLIDPDYADLATEKFEEALKGKPQEYELVALAKDGRRIPASISTIPIIVDNKVTGVFGIAKDKTKEKEAFHRIQQLAYTDQLTGLANRRWFYQQLEKVISKSREEQHSVAVLAIDFDDFKDINDSLGHHIGDLFLQKVSQKLNDFKKENSYIARVGGDEFCILLEDVTKEETIRITENMLRALNCPITISGHELLVTLSIGISIESGSSIDAEALLSQADLAMYLAKEKGKNNYQFFNERLNEKIERRLQLENALRKAIQNNELTLVYQPQVDIHSNQLVGLEALLRWNPSFGNVRPDEFIPIAERTGLIVPIGEWVLREACRRINQWKEHKYLHVPISINISARQFSDPRFRDKVLQIVKEENIDPEYLEIEITESVMMNLDDYSQLVQELRELGIKFAIDDFGAGYSSLHLIATLDYDTLKIDKSLIDDAIQNVRKRQILKAVIESITSERIVVEGIETKEQVELLKNYNIIGQGYYFSRPLPPEEL